MSITSRPSGVVSTMSPAQTVETENA